MPIFVVDHSSNKFNACKTIARSGNLLIYSASVLLRSVYLSIPLHPQQELTSEEKCERHVKQESSNEAKCDRCSRYATPIVIAFSSHSLPP